MSKAKIHTAQDVVELNKRKYKQGEMQTIWDYLDSLKKEVTQLKRENTKLKKQLK